MTDSTQVHSGDPVLRPPEHRWRGHVRVVPHRSDRPARVPRDDERFVTLSIDQRAGSDAVDADTVEDSFALTS